MAIDASSGLRSAPSPAEVRATPAASGKDELGRDAFLRLLTTQLRHQDPLEPVSGTEFVSELATFSTLESMDRLNGSFQQLLLLQQVSQGAALIGREVGYRASGAAGEGRGVVEGVSIQNGQLALQIGTASVPLAQVQSIAG